jgi:hypothetical protein
MLFAGIRNVHHLKLYRQSYLECHLLKELDGSAIDVCRKFEGC